MFFILFPIVFHPTQPNKFMLNIRVIPADNFAQSQKLLIFAP